MYLIICGFIVWCIILIILFYKIKKNKKHDILSKMLICFVVSGIIITYLIVIINSILLKVLPYENILYKQTWSIKSLSLSKNIDFNINSFLLGFNIDSNNEFNYYFYVDSFNGVILFNLKAKDVFIIETSSEPKLIRTFTYRKYKYPNFILGYTDYSTYNRENYKWYMEVPVDTIKYNFDINTKELK